MNDAAKRRLVDRLRADVSRTGRVRRLLVTTHNLQADFFDSDFLGTALSISRPDFSGFSGQLALQRKLAGLDYCGVLCEARAYEQRPSLRTVVHPVTLRGACLHAKLVVVEYDHAVRILVGSANLTQQGYRENREVCGEWLAHHDEPKLLGQAAAILRSARETLGRFEERAQEFLVELDVIVARLERWGVEKPTAPPPVVWSDAARPLWRTVLERWPATKQVERISIVSPFWSEDGSTHTPLRRFLGELRDRDALASRCAVDLYVDSKPLADGGFVADRLPVVFFSDFPGLSIRVLPVDPRVEAADLDVHVDLTATRKLHAKLLVLAARDTALAYAGSANFTRNGYGVRGARSETVGSAANIEAGWLFELQPGGVAALLPPPANEGQPLSTLSQPGPASSVEEDAEPPIFWPTPLLSAELTPAAEEDVLMLTTCWSEESPGGWSVHAGSQIGAGSEQPLFTTAAGPGTVVTVLSARALQTLLRERHILIVTAEGSAPFPVNVAAGEARHRLPLSPAGKQPGESDLLSYYQGRISFDDLYPDPEASPDNNDNLGTSGKGDHMVDKSRIQAYQIRAFVDALPGMRQELLAVCGTRGMLYQAFLGEISPVALSEHVLSQVAQGSRTPTAAAFQLAELGALLRSVATQAPPDVEHFAEVCSEAQRVIGRRLERLRAQYEPELSATSAFARYVASLQEVQA